MELKVTPLDAPLGARITGLDLSKTLGVTSVVVTHKMESAFRIADRLLMLYDGKVRAEGTVEQFRASDDLRS